MLGNKTGLAERRLGGFVFQGRHCSETGCTLAYLWEVVRDFLVFPLFHSFTYKATGPLSFLTFTLPILSPIPLWESEQETVHVPIYQPRSTHENIEKSHGLCQDTVSYSEFNNLGGS